jgi:pyruvate/2-oxoglutarate/acetoin dehydrogenase E1 component
VGRIRGHGKGGARRGQRRHRPPRQSRCPIPRPRLSICSPTPRPLLRTQHLPATAPETVIVDAINHALHEEMERDEKIIVYGQDVEDGKGGVFTATKGLSTKFGLSRCFNSPLAESSIVGTAVGLAVRGYKPVVEIQFGDYIWTAMMHIRNEVATMRYRSNNHFSAPVVMRVPVGGYIHGALCHSQSIDGYFTHIPGCTWLYPSTAADAKGTAEGGLPHGRSRALSRAQGHLPPELVPRRSSRIPTGCCPSARPVRREGSDVTVVTWGAIVYKRARGRAAPSTRRASRSRSSTCAPSSTVDVGKRPCPAGIHLLPKTGFQEDQVAPRRQVVPTHTQRPGRIR